jgi:hypothetical protein
MQVQLAAINAVGVNDVVITKLNSPLDDSQK